MFDGNDGGVWKFLPATVPGPGTWANLNTFGLQSHKVASVGLHPTTPTTLLVGSDDNGFALTTDGGRTWGEVGSGDGGMCRFGPDGAAYAANAVGSAGNRVLERSPDGSNGNWVDITPQPVDPHGYPPYPVFAINPLARRNLLFGGIGRVWRTVNSGLPAGAPTAWVPFNPPAAFPSARVTSLTCAPIAGDLWGLVAYAGFSNGQVFRTDNASERDRPWVNLTGTSPPWGSNNAITCIAPDPSRLGEVYLTVEVYGQPQVWFSSNSGVMWNQISRIFVLVAPLPGGLPNVPVRVLVVDPKAANRIVYAGTDVGVFRGIQGARGLWSWQRFGNGQPNQDVPNVAVFDLQLVGRLMVAAAEGRGLWKTYLGVPGAAIEGQPAIGLGLGTFTEPGGQGGQAVQSINWGDGSALDTTSGTLTWSGTTATVKGNHTFADEGSFTATLTITKSGSVALILTTMIAVEDAALTATGTAVSATENTPLSGVQVATLTDANSLSVPTEYLAVIFWGDGILSLGTVSGSGGNYTITGNHTYTNAGAFPVSVTVTELDGTSYALASSTATVSGALDLTAVSVSATEASPTGTVTVATFTDTFAHPLPSDYTVTLNWADGNLSTGTVTATGGNSFKITGGNTYAQAGTFALTIAVQNLRGAAAAILNPVTVADAALTGLGMTLAATEGVALVDAVVARFSDADPNAPLSTYTATIDWGDTQPTAQEGPPLVDPDTIGTVVLETGGTYAVQGGHTYEEAGTYTITVSLSDVGGSSVEVISTVTVAGAAPAVTAISPLEGPTAGGVSVTISGTNLAGATAVSFGGTAATTFQNNDDGTITAVAPAGTAGTTVDVTVTTAYGTSATGPADQFTYLAAAPSVTSLSPTSGPTGGGTSVTITGTNLAGASQVFFGGIAGTDLSVTSATTLTATAPAQAAAIVDVTVSGPYGVSSTSGADQYTYVATAPTVTGLDTPAGPTAGGTVVTIYGANFNGVTAVAFGSTAAASFTFLSATALRATAPAGSAGTVDVRVTSPYGTSAISSADQFTFTAAPSVTAIAPAAGPTGGGTTVAVTGTNLTGTTQVLFGSVPAAGFTVTSSTALTATAPPQGPGVVDVTVTTPGGMSPTSLADQFTVQATAPAVTGVAPGRGPTTGGTTVTLTGSNLTGATQVLFGSVAAAGYYIPADTQIIATAPPAAPGTIDIKVTTPYGTSPAVPADQFTFASAAAPAVSGVSPASGPMAGGNAVLISGSGFTAATAVSFGLVAASAVTVVSDTQISATAPTQAAGAVDILVTTPYGASTPVPADGYTYLAVVPTVTGISPTAGSTAGGVQVTVSGANLMGARRVAFGTVLASSVTVTADNTLTATAPVQAVGVVDVTVSTPAGTSTTSAADQFTYTAAANLPAVTGISPGSGPTGGGTVVTLSGSGLTGATAVLFGTANAVSFNVVSDTALTATAPPQAAATVDVTVSTAAGISTSGAPDRYTFIATAPVVTAISPSSGPTSGGAVVTLTGSNFNGATAVKFGTLAATSFKVRSATQVTAAAPAQAAGVVDIFVTTSYGTSAASGADRFTYATVPAPTVTGVSPAAGPLAGGNAVTITGANFTSASAVKFGSTAAAGFSVLSATQLVALSPAAPSGTVHITVTTAAGTSATVVADEFVFSTSAPTITGLSPNSGPPAGGTAVVVTGTGFSSVSNVTFGTTAAVYTVNSATQITATAPAQPTGAVDVSVVTAGGTSALSAADVFTYPAPLPAVTAVSPSTGPTGGGTLVTVTGSGFTGTTQVAFGATAAAFFKVASDTSLTVYSPLAAAGVIDITVTSSVGTSATVAADQFTYTSGAGTPALTGLSPTSGPTSGGTAVTLTGTSLTGATQVLFGSVPAASVTVVSGTSLTAVAPYQAAGLVDVTVTTQGGTSSTSAADQYTFVAAVPTVTGVSPTAGSTTGGTAVAVTGTNFNGATQVLFGGVPASSVAVVSNTALTAVAPVSAAGIVDVTVVSPSGTSATSGADQFTYSAAANLPTVTAISPTSGPTGGGTTVTVSGTNFTNVQGVSFGAVPASFWTVTAPTALTVTAPYQAAAVVDVTVSTVAGTSASTAADHYTYVGTAPTVSGISPTSGSTLGGAGVTITGTNLNGATQVSFGGTAATAFNVNSATQVTATAPALAAGTYDVTVTTPNGTSATSPADQFTALALPTVASVSPASGPVGGGTSVTVTGTNFTGLVSVAFGAVAASSVTVNSATQITATSPAGTPGTVDITITSAAGTSATSSADQFNYPVPVAVVTGISPNSGPVAGLNTTTITGSGFTGATAVSFGTTNASMFHVNSDTQIAVTVPGTTVAGTVDVTVTSLYGIRSATAPGDQYSYV